MVWDAWLPRPVRICPSPASRRRTPTSPSIRCASSDQTQAAARENRIAGRPHQTSISHCRPDKPSIVKIPLLWCGCTGNERFSSRPHHRVLATTTLPVRLLPGHTRSPDGQSRIVPAISIIFIRNLAIAAPHLGCARRHQPPWQPIRICSRKLGNRSRTSI